MLSLQPELEALYNGSGEHLGGIYAPLMVDGVLTQTHANCLASRPASRLLYHPAVCPNPTERLGLVWMCPNAAPDPLAASPAALPFLVHALDGGMSVQVHAGSEEAIGAMIRVLGPLVGGGHA